MAGEIFKKQTVRYFRQDGKRCTAAEATERVQEGKPVLKAGYRREVEMSSKWFGTVGTRAVPLCRDKSASQKMLNKLLTDAALGSVGMANPFRDSHKRSLSSHLDDWKADLLARGRTTKHADTSVSRARRVIECCKFTVIPDLSASRVQAFLAELRDSGTSVATCNHILTACKMFCRWLQKDHRTGDNPLAHLSSGNAKLDRRRTRRELTDQEIAILLGVTRTGPTLYRLSGVDREMLYRTALLTGLRAK